MTIPAGMICRAYITINGEKIYAKDRGLRAFCFFPQKKKEDNVSVSQNREIKKATSVKK